MESLCVPFASQFLSCLNTEAGPGHVACCGQWNNKNRAQKETLSSARGCLLLCGTPAVTMRLCPGCLRERGMRGTHEVGHLPFQNRPDGPARAPARWAEAGARGCRGLAGSAGPHQPHLSCNEGTNSWVTFGFWPLQSSCIEGNGHTLNCTHRKCTIR